MTLLVDSHCHLDAAEFDHDRAEVIERARASCVQQIVVPAIGFSGWQKLKTICASHSGLYAAYGLHPMFLDQHNPEHLSALIHWVEQEKPHAVGECGLDFFIESLNPEAQRLYFRRQLEIARDFDLPVILHARRAVDEVIATIRHVGQLRGVVHSFSGSEQQAQQLFALGFYLGIGGPVTFERAQRLRRLVATMPLEFLVLESDAPDQPDANHRGQRNEPAHLDEVLRVVAALRGQAEENIADATTSNAHRLFALAAP